MIPYIINEDRISLFVNGKPVTLSKEDSRFIVVADALRSGASEEEIQKLLNHEEPSISSDDNLSPALAKRIRYMREQGLPLKPIERFIANLEQNPSKESAADLYGFLEECDLPITEDGCFLAYKRVNENYRDCKTDTIDNSVGKTVSMSRDDVDPDRENTCSSGLHICSLSYLQHFLGAHTVVVKVNPKDVVAVPVDYNNAKMRVCEYTVIGEIEPESGENIKPLIVSDVVEQQKGKLKKAKAVVGELDKAGRFDRYVSERNLPEDITSLAKNQKITLRKFAARLLFGGNHAPGEAINKCKTLTELKTVVCGE